MVRRRGKGGQKNNVFKGSIQCCMYMVNLCVASIVASIVVSIVVSIQMKLKIKRALTD